jgi:hypothetical protein
MIKKLGDRFFKVIQQDTILIMVGNNLIIQEYFFLKVHRVRESCAKQANAKNTENRMSTMIKTINFNEINLLF